MTNQKYLKQTTISCHVIATIFFTETNREGTKHC